MNLIYDSFIKKIEILSEALEKAAERTRTMLYVVTFFSLLIIVTAFNAYLSWDRKLNANERFLLSTEMEVIPLSSLKPHNLWLANNLNECHLKIDLSLLNDKPAKVINDLENKAKTNLCVRGLLDRYKDSLRKNGLILNQTEYFKIFIERQKFTIPIIGLSCYADDVYLIGGLGLLILLTYSFFSVRRENRIVQRIAKAIDYIDSQDPKEYLHNHNYNARQLALIKHNLIEYIFYGCAEFFIFNTGLSKTDLSTEDQNIKTTNTSGRLVLSWLFYFPLFAMLFALTFEIRSVYQRHQFFTDLDFSELSVRYLLTTAFLILIIKQSRWIVKLNNDNSELVEKMLKKVIKSREDVNLD